MKRFTAIILVLTMILALCACGSSAGTEADEKSLSVGYAREDITPNFSVGLGGYGDEESRRSAGIKDYIYVTCVAVTSGEETILMFTLDLLSASRALMDEIRQSVTIATGINGEKIFVSATHTHSAPNPAFGDDASNQYKSLLLGAAATAAEKALADRTSAELLAATTVVEGMNFVRHYEMSDGTYAGSNFGSFTASEIVGHATKTDPQMVLVKFDRGEDKQDVLLMNWQAHPANGQENGYTNISADFCGAIREKLELETGMLFAYFTGASGNQNRSSQIAAEDPGLSVKEYGYALADAAVLALPELKAAEGTAIKTQRLMYTGQIDHSWDHMLTQANEVYNLWKSAGISTGNAKAAEYGFTSVYQAAYIQQRAAMGLTAPLELNAFSIGSIGFVTGTYEMFSDAGLYIKEHSPFDITFICTSNNTYIPSKEAYDYRAYEADTAMFEKGTAETLAEEYVKLLGQVK